jgi:phosphonoacetaldehyde hydrolase
MLKYKGVIFDLSGVLIDFGVKVPLIAMANAFHLNNIHISDNLIRFGMGKSMKQYIKSLCHIYNVQHKFHKIENDFTKSVMYLTNDNTYHDKINGAGEIIHKLKTNNIKIGLMTIYDRKYFNLFKYKLNKDGILFDEIICADDYLTNRPEPWQLLRLIERLNVYPHDCIKIGESHINICESKRANINTIQIIDSSSDMNIEEIEFEDMNDSLKNMKRNDIINKLDLYDCHLSYIKTIQDINNLI